MLNLVVDELAEQKKHDKDLNLHVQSDMYAGNSITWFIVNILSTWL